MSRTLTAQEENPAELHLATRRVQLKRVLLATDFSADSRVALKTAMAIVMRSEGELFLLHAAPRVLYSPDITITSEVLMATEDAARSLMNDFMSAEPELKIIKHLPITTSLPIVDAVNEATACYHIDLVVTGTHGAHGIEKLAVGSAAEAILRHSHVPVLIVGPGAGASSMPVRSVVFATDLEIGCLRPAQYAAGVAEEMGARLTLVHVIAANVRVSGESRNLVEKVKIDELKQLLPADINRWCRTKLRVEFGDAGTEILAAAQAEAANLIVMGMHPGALLADHAPWAIASKVIRNAGCPVLAVQSHVT